MGGGGQQQAMGAARLRHLGGTEEAWRQAFDCGTGHTVLGVLMRRLLDRATVQRAVDAVLRENPRARSELLVPVVPLPQHGRAPGHEQRPGDAREGGAEGPGLRGQDEELRLLAQQHPGKPLLRVPEVGSVRVHLASGWQPRDSMELLGSQQQPPGQAWPEESLATASNHVSSRGEGTTPAAGWPSLDMCFEIGRRMEPAAAAGEAQKKSACSCGCGCGAGSPSLEGRDEGRSVQNDARTPASEEDSAGRAGSEGAEVAAGGAESPQEGAPPDPLRCGAGVCCCGVRSGRYKLSMCQDKWLQIVEAAMNEPWENDPEEDDAESEGLEGQPLAEGMSSASSAQGGAPLLQLESTEYRGMKLLKVTLHRLPPTHSLVLMRVHTMACDRVSSALLMEEILKALKSQAGEQDVFQSDAARTDSDDDADFFYDCEPASTASVDLVGTTLEQLSGLEQEDVTSQFSGGEKHVGEDEGERMRRLNLNSVEDCIPHKLSRKPIWAHGVDVLGYGLGSRRHAYLPFREPAEHSHSQLIRSGLSRPDTDTLLEACKRERSSLHGLLSAAVLKAAAQSKALGARGEHFGITTLMDLRPMLEDCLHPRTMGFYHSALMNTHHVSEETGLWDLARRCHDSVAHAVAKRKQFTDMGDLVMLMGQAMQHPNLTPAGSLRTSLLSIFKDTLHEKMDDFVSALDVEDYIGCSSVHGVGPCIAVFDSIREDGLHMANVYPAPLFSRSQMRRLVIHAMELLHGAIASARS